MPSQNNEIQETVNLEAFVSYGKVLTSKDGIIEIAGLRDVMAGEVVKLGNEQMGMISNLEKNSVSAIVLGDDTTIRQGDLVTSTGSLLYVPVGRNLLGRVVDSLGVPIDGLDAIEYSEFGYIETKAPGIITRKSVHEAMQTGILCIDSAVSIGRGQRELIIGDRQTGKTTIAIDTILNHKGLAANDLQKLYCIYVAVGQKRTSVVNLVEKLKAENAFDYVTVVSATASDPASLQYLAPYAGCTMGEYFRDNQTH